MEKNCASDLPGGGLYLTFAVHSTEVALPLLEADRGDEFEGVVACMAGAGAFGTETQSGSGFDPSLNRKSNDLDNRDRVSRGPCLV